MDTSSAVLCGIDVGKSEHHAVGLDSQRARLYDRSVAQRRGPFAAVFDELPAHGPVLIVVDQRGPRTSSVGAAQHDRSIAGDRDSGVRPSGGLSAGVIDAPDR
jgi:hypothetical protein